MELLAREVGESQFLDVFKERQDMALSCLLWDQSQVGLDDFEGFFQSQ